MGAADAFQQQAGDLRLPVELALGHPQLLLRLSGGGEGKGGAHTQGPHVQYQKEIKLRWGGRGSGNNTRSVLPRFEGKTLQVCLRLHVMKTSGRVGDEVE